MPKIYKKKTGAKRRVFRKKRAKMTLKNRVNMGQGFPKTVLVKHKYVDSQQVAIAAGVMQQYRYRCNSMYDPNQTGIGAQPMLFDNFAAIYRHYVVIGSRIVIKCFPTTANPPPTAIGIFVNDDTSTTSTNYLNLAEQSSGTVRYMAYNNSVPLTVTKNWSAKKSFPGSVLANNSLQGSDSANPTEEQFYNIFIQPVDGVSSLTINVQVEIQYIAVWRELRDLAGS